jgi:hypothetical protein
MWRRQIAGEMSQHFTVDEQFIAHQDDLAKDIGSGAVMFDFVLCTKIIKTIRLLDRIVIDVLHIISAILHDDLRAGIHIL